MKLRPKAGHLVRHLVLWAGLSAGLAVLVVPSGASDPDTQLRAEPRRGGKVVRVERARVVRRAPVLFCPMPFTDKNRGVCYGRAPAVGDKALMFDYEQHYIGQLRVTSVGPSQNDPCDSGTAFDFTYELTDKVDAAFKRGMLFSIATFGLDLDSRRAQLITDNGQLPNPGQSSRAQPWMGLDRDGDSIADVVVTAFECTDVAPAPPARVATGHKQTFCLDYWLSDLGKYQKLRRDYVYTCS